MPIPGTEDHHWSKRHEDRVRESGFSILTVLIGRCDLLVHHQDPRQIKPTEHMPNPCGRLVSGASRERNVATQDRPCRKTCVSVGKQQTVQRSMYIRISTIICYDCDKNRADFPTILVGMGLEIFP